MPRRRSPRTGFEQRFLANLRVAGIEPGARLTIGFSGGVDSLALASAAHRVAPLLDLQLLLVHVDHGLRPASAAGAIRGQELANIIGVDFRAVSLAGGLSDRTRGIGTEEAARRERYLALSEAARDWDSNTIVLGHQANDQAETLLLHLFRGAGLPGMSGMQLCESRTIPWWTSEASSQSEFRLVRPLLTETRSVIESYVAERGLEPVDDDSNAYDDFDRNWIRHHVITSVEERWPAVVDTLARSAQLFQFEDEFAERATQEFSNSTQDHVRTLRTDSLVSIFPAIALRAIRAWLLRLGIDEPPFDVVARVYELAQSGDEQRIVEVGGHTRVVLSNSHLVTFDDLVLTAHDALPMLSSCKEPPAWAIDISDPGSADSVSLQIPAHSDLEVRALTEGDRWFGTNRSVFEDVRASGIHPLVRTRLLAVATAGGVLLIPAIYPNIRAKVEATNGKVVGVRWSKAE